MHRLRLIPMLVISGSLLAVLAIGPADAAKKSCKNKKEQSGCKLPKEASYGGFKDPMAAGLSVDEDGRAWRAYVRVAKCNRRGNVSQSFRGRPKVGKTYKVSISDRMGAGTIRIFTDASGTLKINSAKKATFTGTYSRRVESRTGDPTPCTGSATVVAKRTK